MNRRRVALAALAGLFLASCAPHGITKTGEEVAGLYDIVLVIAIVVFAGVELAIIYNAIRYRQRKRDRDAAIPEQIHGNTAIEIVWTAIPSVIVLVLFVMSMVVLADVNREECSTAPNAKVSPPGCADLVVDVTGYQWQWSFAYKDSSNRSLGVTESAQGQFQPPTLVLPVGKRIHINLIAAETDVIHSFFVPGLIFKRDLVPVPPSQSPNSFEITINPQDAGLYHGQCAELCGDYHNAMTFALRAVTPAEFQTWLTQEAARQRKQGACSPQGTTVKVLAKGIHFDENCYAAPANQPFTVSFTNQDAGVPHNFAIYTGKSATEAVLEDPAFNGVATRTYKVKSLQAGKYYFQCDVHPGSMNGTFVVK